ncbi:MAG: MotA/TolQ/ExbB proton channel family protein [Bacteriovoracaceae bacterium]|nr:MotA/TolQ/ExbB proton channel family protein [Bacteriovoracaceae bacterium]
MNIGNLSILTIIWESGLVVKFVLLLLFLASIFSWAIIIKKLRQFRKINLENKLFMDIYQESKNLSEVMGNSEHLLSNPLRIVFQEGYGELMKLRKNIVGDSKDTAMKKHFQDFGMGLLTRAIQKGGGRINLDMELMLSNLASVGSVSPFVGLFGTVWGIINAFTGLASGSAALDAVAPGIAEALVATAIGLFAAIPAVWFYNFFNNKISRINVQIDGFEQDFLNVVERTIVAK